MEDKQLDFDQPLLSVRRYNNTPTKKTERTNSGPPSYTTQLKSGPISNPGVVPFRWEHTPGQPKHPQIKPKSLTHDRPPIAPKLPPGRHQNHNNVNSPTSRFQHENVENGKEKTDSNESCSDSGDSEGAYVDALDTLSRTESFFLNCSNTGLSGFDDIQVKPSSTSLETRDFMMGRFLPAAKAMAAEMPPQYAPRKQHEQGQRLKKIVVNNDKPSLRYGPSFTNRYSHYHDNNEEEDESDVEENLPAVCGLLPRFCLKNSLGRLNPVPAMSVRTRAPISRTHIPQQRSSSSVSYSETEFESKSDISEVKSMDKIPKAAVNEDKTNLRNESGQLEIQLYGDVPKESTRAGNKGFGFHGNGFKTFEELSVDQSSENELNSWSPIEKILYVDTIKKVKPPILTPFSPNTRHTKEAHGSKEEVHEIISKSVDQLNICDVDGEAKSPLNGENYNKNYSKFPVPPPLPNSPSDSWLWRTLPSMSTKNLSLQTYLHSATNTQKQGSYKLPTNDTKWETIVKTTKEMLTTTPET